MSKSADLLLTPAHLCTKHPAPAVPWAWLHDKVPHRPFAKVAPVGAREIDVKPDRTKEPIGCQLATMALKSKLSLSHNVGCTAEVVTQSGTLSSVAYLG